MPNPKSTRSNGTDLLAFSPWSRLSTDFWAIRSRGNKSSAVNRYKSTTSRISPASTSCVTVSFPSPSTFMALREMKWLMRPRTCAGHVALLGQ